jgi:hypothetical protein
VLALRGPVRDGLAGAADPAGPLARGATGYEGFVRNLVRISGSRHWPQSEILHPVGLHVMCAQPQTWRLVQPTWLDRKISLIHILDEALGAMTLPLERARHRSSRMCRPRVTVLTSRFPDGLIRSRKTRLPDPRLADE